MKGTNTYRLLRGRKYIGGQWYEAGDLVQLTENQALNLRLSIEPYDSSAHISQFEEVTTSESVDSTDPKAEFKTTLADTTLQDYEEEWLDDEDTEDEE